VLTDPGLPSGSDRIHAALEALDPERRHDVVVNLQGDLPALDPGQIRAVAKALQDSGADIATLAAEIIDPAERDNPSVVKAVVAWDQGGRLGRALYFTRATAPDGEGPLFHHVGIYAYRREALARFVALPPSPLEMREKLEQLRALEANMSIAVARVDSVPLSVDTPADLERARKILS
jgi:3-deoxy-manno-octulosonate cytidylyltransferase (CMP-KDO synthetase)